MFSDVDQVDFDQEFINSICWLLIHLLSMHTDNDDLRSGLGDHQFHFHAAYFRIDVINEENVIRGWFNRRTIAVASFNSIEHLS